MYFSPCACNFVTSPTSLSTSHGPLGVPLLYVEDDILRASENRMAHHWSPDAAKAGLTNADASEVQAGGIREGWWPWEDRGEGRCVHGLAVPQLQQVPGLRECPLALKCGHLANVVFLSVVLGEQRLLAVSVLSPSVNWIHPPFFAPRWFTLKLKSWLLAHFIAPLVVSNAWAQLRADKRSSWPRNPSLWEITEKSQAT